MLAQQATIIIFQTYSYIIMQDIYKQSSVQFDLFHLNPS